MAVEGTYEYECMRAELLGVEKPDYEEFMRNKTEREAAERDAMESESLRETQAQDEELHHVTGRLDELNNILKSTQKKINNFTAPFSSFLKSKMGMSANTNPQQPEVVEPFNNEHDGLETVPLERTPDMPNPEAPQPKTNHFSMLDSMMNKFERAQGSMEQQNKQMKRFLK